MSMFWSRSNCSVMIELPSELRRGHLAEAGDLSKLALERRRYRRCHHRRVGARIKRHHLNGWVVHFRQRRDGQLPVCNNAHQQHAEHQQRGGDRAQNE